MADCNPIYDVTFFAGGSSGRFNTPDSITEITWGRKLDGISRATISYQKSGPDCCGDLGEIEPLRTEVGIYRDGRLEWYGWVLDVEEGRNDLIVTAVDALWWLTARRQRVDYDWQNTDLTDIFIDLWNEAMSTDPIENTQLVTTPSGVLESRKAQIVDFRYIWNIVQEMLDSGLDVFTLGKSIFAGVPQSLREIEMTMADISGDIRVTKAGSLYASNVVVAGTEQTYGEYPPTDQTSLYYPRVDEIIKDSQVQNVDSAVNRAKARYEYSKIVPRLVKTQDGITLSPDSNITVPILVPGVPIVLETTDLCYAARQAFRLGTLDVTVSSGNELVVIGLQPTGPVASLATSEDPII